MAAQAIEGLRRRFGQGFSAINLILAAVFFAGVAHLAFLPVWEGFDEYAHYSSVQQIADTGTIPRYGVAHLSADVERYPGPWPYTSVGGPNFDPPGHPSYRSYRESGGALARHVQRQYQPAADLNWQAQHAPLFYALMAPVYLATKTWSWVDHLFVLRFAAWTIAFAGIAIGAKATARLTGDDRSGLVIAAYPLLAPEFFSEMARLGNDSLCLLLLSAAWATSLGMLKGQGGYRPALALAGVLGLGLLTKAFFLAVTAGVVALLALRWIKSRTADDLRDVLVVGAGAAALGLWWYVRNYIELGSFTGANDFIRTSAGFDMWRGLLENFSLSRVIHGGAELLMTYAAVGTWSLVIPPLALWVAPLLLPAFALTSWALRSRKQVDLAGLAPVFFVAPLLGGLLWHMLHNLALPARMAGTPGWYLHIAAAPIAFAMARGWRPRLCAALAALAFAAWIALELLLLSLFSGCSIKTGSGKGYVFDGASCFIDLRALDAIATPWLGIVASALVIGLLAAAAWKSRVFTPRPAPSASLSDALRSGS